MFSRCILAFALSLISVCTTTIFAAEPKSWTPALSTMEGKIEILQSVLARHPGLVTANLQFKRPLVQVLEGAERVRSKYPALTRPFEIFEGARMVSRFLPGKELDYDEPRLEDLRAFLAEKYMKLQTSRLGKSLVEDLKILDIAQAKLFFSVLPFLYDAQGKKKNGARALLEVNTASGSLIDNYYNDLYRHHLEPLLEEFSKQKGNAEYWRAYQTVKNNFIKTTIEPALKLVADGEVNTSIRTISIEEIPPVIALFRGSFGGDCSILSVPHFVLAKDTTVFWIRKSASFEGQPNGYVLVTLAKSGEKIVPYIVTINGASLSSDDVSHVVSMIAEHYGTEHVLLPDLAKNPALINSTAARDGMSRAESTKVKITLSDNWIAISKDTTENKIAYGNYYNHESLEEAYLAKVAHPQSVVSVPPKLAYTKQSNFDTLPLLDRALLAASILDGDLTYRPDVMRIYHVNEEQINAADAILNRMSSETQPDGLNALQLDTAQRILGFSEKHLMKLDAVTRAMTIGYQRLGVPATLSAEFINEAKIKTQADLDRMLENPENFSNTAMIWKAKLFLALASHDDAPIYSFLSLLKSPSINPGIKKKAVSALQLEQLYPIPEWFFEDFFDWAARLDEYTYKTLRLDDVMWRMRNRYSQPDLIGKLPISLLNRAKRYLENVNPLFAARVYNFLSLVPELPASIEAIRVKVITEKGAPLEVLEAGIESFEFIDLAKPWSEAQWQIVGKLLETLELNRDGYAGGLRKIRDHLVSYEKVWPAMFWKLLLRHNLSANNRSGQANVLQILGLANKKWPRVFEQGMYELILKGDEESQGWGLKVLTISSAEWPEEVESAVLAHVKKGLESGAWTDEKPKLALSALKVKTIWGEETWDQMAYIASVRNDGPFYRQAYELFYDRISKTSWDAKLWSRMIKLWERSHPSREEVSDEAGLVTTQPIETWPDAFWEALLHSLSENWSSPRAINFLEKILYKRRNVPPKKYLQRLITAATPYTGNPGVGGQHVELLWYVEFLTKHPDCQGLLVKP